MRRIPAGSSGFRCLLALLLSEQLLIPPSAWALAADGSTLAGDRGVQPAAGALAAALPADLFSGAATHRIPIELPQGTGGMTPELALSYSSAGPLDSWVGSRWSLALPSISRSLKRGFPAYDATDVFTLDGQELVPENGNTSLPRRYHTRRESFLRITREANSSWTVERKDGVVMRFGLSPNARIAKNPSGAPNFQFLLSEQEDPHGNVITVVYDRGDVGRAYPDEIRYTLRRVGSGLQSLDGDSNRDRVVKFEYEPRPDAPVLLTGYTLDQVWDLWQQNGEGGGEEAPPDAPPYREDPTAPPAEGFEWRGPPGSTPGSSEGAWYNPETGLSVHPDRGHGAPIGPHNDISVKGDKGGGWRQLPDGSIRRK